MTAPSGFKRSRRAQYTARRLRHAVSGQAEMSRSRNASRSVRHRNETRAATLIGVLEVKSGTRGDEHAGGMPRAENDASGLPMRQRLRTIHTLLPCIRFRMRSCQSCRPWRRAVSCNNDWLVIQRRNHRRAEYRNKDQREYQHRCKGHRLRPTRIFFHGVHSL